MSTLSLLQLPDNAILEVLRHLDARSLVHVEQTNSYFSRKEPSSRLTLVEAVAREAVQRLCCSNSQAERFRNRSWRERLYLENETGAGFDRTFSEAGGFSFQFNNSGDALRSIRLTGMGPKLLVSDLSTRDQSVLRWRLRVKGNTAVEFGVIPADLELSHTALHKCMANPGSPNQSAMGFCSQITAGSLLPLKAPVMRGTVLDIVARRGHVEVLLTYPEDAKEISWQNGQPVQRPYRGPSQLRFEQDFSDNYHLRLAVTSWAKAHFEVLHTGFAIDPEWVSAAQAAESAAAAEAAAQPAPEPQAMPGMLFAAAEEPEDAELALPHQQFHAGQLDYGLQQQAALLQPLPEELAGPAPAAAAVAAIHAQQLQQMVAGAVHAAAQDAAAMAATGDAAAAEMQFDVQQLAGGLLAEPVALAAAAMAASGLDAEPLEVLQHLHALHHHQLQQEPLPLGAEAHPEAEAAGAAVLACHDAPADAARPTNSEQMQQMTNAAGPGDAPAVSALPAPNLCRTPSAELSEDGHLRPPSQG